MDKIEIWGKGEYNYPLAFDFTPNMRPYLIDDGEVHPCIIVLPGGGYAVVVPPEGELVAKEFNKRGYNCFVMTYTTNQTMREPVMDQAMKDLARAIRFTRKNCERYTAADSRQQVMYAHVSAITGMRSQTATRNIRTFPAVRMQRSSPTLSLLQVNMPTRIRSVSC